MIMDRQRVTTKIQSLTRTNLTLDCSGDDCEGELVVAACHDGYESRTLESQTGLFSLALVSGNSIPDRLKQLGVEPYRLA